MHHPNYLLKISTPCQENWDVMMPDTQGRFCNSCSKQVVDFTGMSDPEIMNLISRTKGSLCGRLMKSQMDRELVHQSGKSQHTPFKHVITGLFFLSLAEQASAGQHMAPWNVSPKLNSQQSSLHPINLIQNPVISSDTAIRIIKGQLIDSISRQPLEGAIVRFKGKRIGVSTNDKGFFILNVPDSLVANTIFLNISSIGYQTATFVINSDNASSHQFFLQPLRDTLTGDVVIVRIKKKKWWKFWE
jgi:hypothetical protein